MCRDRSINDEFPALAEYLPQNYVKELYQDDAVNVTLVPQKKTFLAQTPPFVQSCRGHIIITAEEQNECELGISSCNLTTTDRTTVLSRSIRSRRRGVLNRRALLPLCDLVNRQQAQAAQPQPSLRSDLDNLDRPTNRFKFLAEGIV